MATINVTTGTGSATVTVSTGARGPAGAAGPGTNVTVSTTPPTNPDEGDKWIDSESMVESVWYDDGTDGGVWVQTSGDTANATSSDLAPVAVADSTERKLAATYTALDITPTNGLRVIQDDLPDVVWTLLDDSDITADANWYGGPRTNASGQLPLADVALNTGNVTFCASRKILPSTDPASIWVSSSTGAQKAVVLSPTIYIPASLVVLNGKVRVTGQFTYSKQSSGVNSSAYLSLMRPGYLTDPASVFATSNGVVGNIVSAGAVLEGFITFRFNATFSRAYGTTDKLVLSIDSTTFPDAGRYADFTSSTTAPTWGANSNSTNLTMATGSALPSSAVWTEGQEADLIFAAVCIAANGYNNTASISGNFGISVLAP